MSQIKRAKEILNRPFEKHKLNDLCFECFIQQEMASGSFISIHVENSETLTTTQFRKDFEMSGIPLIIQNSTVHWKAEENWNFQSLEKSYAECEFMCGENEETYEPVMISMGEFLEYMKTNDDTSPLYIFDSTFYFDQLGKAILSDYSVPKYFPTNPDQSSSLGTNLAHVPSSSSLVGDEVEKDEELNFSYDLLSYLSEQRRPPYRWFLLGPKRSGSKIHKDPFGTCAWNTIVHGRKLWLMMPPNTEEAVARGEGLCTEIDETNFEPYQYFTQILPQLRSKYSDLSIYVNIQESGDTMFVPSGWWHTVLNLTDTVAITQNYCSLSNFKTVVHEMNHEDAYDRERVDVWIQNLNERYPGELPVL